MAKFSKVFFHNPFNFWIVETNLLFLRLVIYVSFLDRSNSLLILLIFFKEQAFGFTDFSIVLVSYFTGFCPNLYYILPFTCFEFGLLYSLLLTVLRQKIKIIHLISFFFANIKSYKFHLSTALIASHNGDMLCFLV